MNIYIRRQVFGASFMDDPLKTERRKNLPPLYRRSSRRMLTWRSCPWWRWHWWVWMGRWRAALSSTARTGRSRCTCSDSGWGCSPARPPRRFASLKGNKREKCYECLYLIFITTGSAVNLTNILWAAFAPIYFCQKNMNLSREYKKAAQKTLVWKSCM